MAPGPAPLWPLSALSAPQACPLLLGHQTLSPTISATLRRLRAPGRPLQTSCTLSPLLPLHPKAVPLPSLSQSSSGPLPWPPATPQTGHSWSGWFLGSPLRTQPMHWASPIECTQPCCSRCPRSRRGVSARASSLCCLRHLRRCSTRLFVTTSTGTAASWGPTVSPGPPVPPGPPGTPEDVMCDG